MRSRTISLRLIAALALTVPFLLGNPGCGEEDEICTLVHLAPQQCPTAKEEPCDQNIGRAECFGKQLSGPASWTVQCCKKFDKKPPKNVAAVPPGGFSAPPELHLSLPAWLTVELPAQVPVGLTGTAVGGSTLTLDTAFALAPELAGSEVFLPGADFLREVNGFLAALAPGAPLSETAAWVVDSGTVRITDGDPGHFNEVVTLHLELQTFRGEVLAAFAEETSLRAFFFGNLASAVGQVPPGAFRPAGTAGGNDDDDGEDDAGAGAGQGPEALRRALLVALEALEQSAIAGDFEDMLERLAEDLLPRMDGARGGDPGDDWIADPVHAAVTFDAFAKLDGLLRPLLEEDD